MDFKNIGKSFSNIGATITPFASRTFQYTKEQLGQVEDKTQLPPDYIDLEKRVDALKQVHQKMLAVTSQYAHEPYDYPPNIKETFSDLGRTVSEKVTLLSSASSPAEAQAALTAPPSAKPQPKTFSHAIARASLSGSQTLHQQHTGAGEDPLATALEKYALAMERVGEARLAQDAQIQSQFLAGWNTTLNTNLQFATRARKNVEKSRLSLDAVKARVKGNTWKLPGGAGAGQQHDEAELSPEAQEEIEKAEDEFVTQTEEAFGVMKNVLDTPEPLRNLSELINAQMEYYKKSYEILSELAPVIDGLQVEQEANYRKSRENASSLSAPHFCALSSRLKPAASILARPCSGNGVCDYDFWAVANLTLASTFLFPFEKHTSTTLLPTPSHSFPQRTPLERLLGTMLPLGLLSAAQGHPMLVELKNGETLNGHLVQCDTWMNLTLKEVVQTNADGDSFMRIPEVYVKGNNIKYLRVPDEIIDTVKEQQQQQQQQHQHHYQSNFRGGGRGGNHNGGGRGDGQGGRGRGDRGRGGSRGGRGRGRGD